MNLFIFLLSLSFVSYIFCESACNTHKTCGACIGYAFDSCIWCSENKAVTSFRCQPKSYNITNIDWCKSENILAPSFEKIVRQNDDFSSYVQFRPQLMHIKANPGVEVKLNVSYQPAVDFPLDVYFLMDYTYTMKLHKEALQKQALAIFKGLKSMTSNVRLGLGSFVEKPGLPYADINVANTFSYAFKNHLSLTNNTDAFEREINGSQFGSNYDDPEAGLDALMQVMKCERQLGWRKDARRIILLATDNTYHSAGDGKMLGAFKPMTLNMGCKLKDNEYKREDSLKYDYPSVSLINKVATEGNFIIIFAGLSHVRPVYEALSKQISGSKYTELQENSNILVIIRDAYDKSVREINIASSAPPFFRINIDQDCKDSPKKNCEYSPKNFNVTIPITIKSTACSKSDKPEAIIIYPTNGLNEKLKIMFEVDCQCACEKTDPDRASTAKNCNDKGFIQCGACKCDNNWGGDSCEVSCSDETSKVLERKCFLANSTSKCNGHGTCECGKCTCTDGFTGDVCEYDPNSCDTGNNGRICGGRDHGTCRFGKCNCEGDWTGKACDCLVEEKSLKLCTGPFSKEICSGRGQCECGRCMCGKVPYKNETYSGAFCDFCEECALEQCQKLEGYAKCNHNAKKYICDKEFDLTAEINVDVVVANKSELNKMDEWNTGTQCRTPLDDGTVLLFKFNTDTKTTLFRDIKDIERNKILLMIQREAEIPPKADILVPIVSAIAGILLIGLLTVVFWKVIIEMYDKREYNKFCSEAKSQGFDVSENILYVPPTQNFVNPGFEQNIQ